MPLETNPRVDARRTVNQMRLSEGGRIFEEANRELGGSEEPREINTYIGRRKYPST